MMYHLSAGGWNCDRRLQSENHINIIIDSTQAVQVYERDLELIRNIRIYRHVGSLTHHSIQADIFLTLRMYVILFFNCSLNIYIFDS